MRYGLKYIFAYICQLFQNHCLKDCPWGFPGGAVLGGPPANAGDTGSSPGLGRSHMPQSN